MAKSRYWKDREYSIDPNHKYTYEELNDRQKRMLKCMPDLTGLKQGRLTVLGFAYIYKHCVYYKCKCECGNECYKTRSSLTSNCQSCGCLIKEALERQSQKIAGTRHKEPYWYELKAVWNDLIRRCHNPKSHLYDKKLYFDKGITVCDEWRKDFKKFYEWSMANGFSNEKMPSGIRALSIDRIDGTKGYSPDNCRWADWKTQRRNQERFIKYGL